MLTIFVLSLESVEYYVGLAAEDYYLKGGEPPGKWTGSGATALGLAGEVTGEQLRALMRGFCPTTGKRLVQNAGKRNGRCSRRPGWDCTTSPPKDVSCLVTVPFLKQPVRSIQERATQAALDFFEATRAFTRVGSVSQGTVRLEKVGLVFAMFEHSVSREMEPQLHTHTLLLNVGIAADGKPRAVHSPPFFGKRQRHLIGAYYRAELAYLLRKELRFETKRKDSSFEVRGVPRILKRIRSTRSRQIEEELKRNGQRGGAAAKQAALKTRRTKTDIPPRKQLEERWDKENRKYGLTNRAVRRLQRAKPVESGWAMEKLIAQALENLSGRTSHFSEIELQIEALQEAPNHGLPPQLVLYAVSDVLHRCEQVIRLGEMDGQRRYTTEKMLENECAMLLAIDKLIQRRGPRAAPLLVAKVLAKDTEMNDEQRAAVRHLTQARGSVRFVDGRAGTGKTWYVIAKCKKIWEKQGYRVIGATFTGKAAVELEEATGIPTDTIHTRLGDYSFSSGFKARHHLKQFARAAKGRRTYRLKPPKPIKIDSKTVLVVDEASMVNTRHWRMLTELVQRGGGLLIAIGDGEQIPAIEGGTPWRSLCSKDRVGCARLLDIQRQKEEWARRAATAAAEGRPGEALQMHAERGLVSVCEDMDDALETLVRDWTTFGLTRPEWAPILVSTNEQVEAANRLCQEQRIRAGILNPRDYVEIVDEDENGVVQYRNRVHVHDRVAFTRNDRRREVRNGFVGTVKAIRRWGTTGARISVELDNGDLRVVPVKKYRHLRLGYAGTVPKLQGGTYRLAYMLAGGPQQDLPTTYVQLTRAVVETHIYTTKALMDEKLEEVQESQLAKQMSRRPDLRLAVDILEGLKTDERAAEAEAQANNDEAKKDQEPQDDRQKRPSDSGRRNGQAHGHTNGTAGPQPTAGARKSQTSAGREALVAALCQEGTPRLEQQRQQYAAAQAEADRRQRALLKQLVTQAAAKGSLHGNGKTNGHSNGTTTTEPTTRGTNDLTSTGREALVAALCQERTPALEQQHQQYTAAQAEADRRQRALLKQLLTQAAGKRSTNGKPKTKAPALGRMFAAMLSTSSRETAVERAEVNPLASELWADISAPPPKRDPERFSEEKTPAAGAETERIEYISEPHGMQFEMPEPEEQSAYVTEKPEPASTRGGADSCDQRQPASTPPWKEEESRSSSPTPTFTSDQGSSHASPDSSTPQNFAPHGFDSMASYQYRGAAQTAASQQPTCTHITQTYTQNSYGH